MFWTLQFIVVLYNQGHIGHIVGKSKLFTLPLLTSITTNDNDCPDQNISMLCCMFKDLKQPIFEFSSEGPLETVQMKTL